MFWRNFSWQITVRLSSVVSAYTMNSDRVLMIPYLSKELNLIGHPTLPYRLENVSRIDKSKIKNRKKVQNELKIVFDSNEMIETLISVCCDLVKQIKALEFNYDESGVNEKINFENVKLQRQLNSCKKEFEKKVDELDVLKKNNSQLQVKVNQLEKKIKECEITKKSAVQKVLINEEVLKHNLKKTESDLVKMHKIVWKQFNMVDQNFFPKNFEIIKLDQPNFNKLWSEEKFSSSEKKENVLKKAVCKYQDNNNILMEDNVILKNLLVITLKEVIDITKFVLNKIRLNNDVVSKDELIQIYQDVEMINVSKYKDVMQKNFNTIKKVFELFEEATFSIADDVFVCWSDILIKSRLLVV